MNTPTNEALLKKIDEAPLLMSREAARKKLRKPRSIYGDQILFMLAITVIATCFYGWRVVAVCVCSVLSCILTDMIGCFLSKKEYGVKDLSTIAYGMALALMLPASVEYYIVVIGAVLAITVKHIFGGKDNYIFNPAAVAIAFLIICYPTQVLMYPQLGTHPEIFGEAGTLVSGIESSFIKNGAMPSLTPLEILMGRFAGPMGTTHILVLIVSGICLICRRSVSLSATVGGIAVMGVLSYLTSSVQPATDAVVFQFISGFVLFGFIFLASDPQTLPLTNGGRMLYGVALGIITVIFRSAANIEGIFVFSLLIVNALSLYLDKLAFVIVTETKQIARYLKHNLGSFERMTKDVKQGRMPSLSDTQEIMIEPVNYNMPPIDNKVTKVKRHKKSVFENISDKISDVAKKKNAAKENNTTQNTADNAVSETEKEAQNGSGKTVEAGKDAEK